MYPLIQPGSLVLIDETRRKIAAGRLDQRIRPAHLLLRTPRRLCVRLVHAHGEPADRATAPASHERARNRTASREEIDVVGQVTGVAMNLDQGKRRRARA